MVCNDHKRIRGLLNDFCSGNYPEIFFLLTALEEKVPSELIASSKTIPYDMLSARLIKRLCINRGVTEAVAHWSIESWALALDVIPAETPYTEPQISFNTPLPGGANAAKMYAKTTEQQTLVVSPTGGQYSSISAALKSAMPNTLILIKPGHYDEGFVINKRVEIRGDGPREDIIIESKDTSCIQMRTDEAVVQGLTLLCRTAQTNRRHAVEIPMGCLKLIDCDITSTIGACVAISGRQTHPEIQGCWLHDAGASGIFIEEHARGIIENCDISGNEYPNISIKPYANPLIKNCKIHDGRSHGILFWAHDSGTVEDCDIFGNALEGVKVKDGGIAPAVRGCRIDKNVPWIYQIGMGNTRFPELAVTSSMPQQRGYPKTYSEATSTGAKYAVEHAVYQPEMSQRPEKRQSLIDAFLRSIGFSREK